MPDDSGTWHYGLVARWWAESTAADPAELAYYLAAIGRYGEPALDLACGTGRLLIPLLAAGLDADGADVSDDMLAGARSVASRAGIDVAGRLFRSTFSELELPRRHRTIVCCDSFGIGGSRTQDERALRSVYRNLEPGGAFVFSIDRAMPTATARLADPARTYPSPWPAVGDRERLADGDELELVTRVAGFDAASMVETMQIRARLWRGDELLAEEGGQLRFTHYEADELVVMLKNVGFADIEVQGRYRGLPAAVDDETIVIVGRRVS